METFRKGKQTMSKILSIIESMLLPKIAVLCSVISLADLFDLLHFLGNRVLMLTLLLVSLVLSSVSFVQARCNQLQEEVQRLQAKKQLEDLDDIVEQVDLPLRGVLNDAYFLEILDFFHTAVQERKVRVRDAARFRHYYAHTFELYPQKTFYAACTLVTAHLWQDQLIEDALKNFIKNGGKVHLLFLLKNAKELATPEVEAVLTGLQAIGVKVLVAYHPSTPHEWKKNYLVEAKGITAWDIDLDHEGNVTSSTLTTSKKLTANYKHMFEKSRGSE